MLGMASPETRYARTVDGVSIAYQIIGDGPEDLVYMPGFTSHVEVAWDHPNSVAFLRRLASISRLIMFDRRGTGLSDSVSEHALPTLEARMDDIRAVMDSAGSNRAFVMGVSESAASCALFAATYPDRTSGLVMIGGYAYSLQAPDYEFGWTEAELEAYRRSKAEGWGRKEFFDADARDIAPSVADDDSFREWWARYMRMGASPSAALAIELMSEDVDIRALLSTIQAPTLVLHSTADTNVPVAHGRYLAEHIPGAKLVEFESGDHVPFTTSGHREEVVREIERFISERRDEEAVFSRVLATVLFSDLVGSTEKAVELGGRAWRELLERHNAVVRAVLGRYRGTEISTAGDGFFATFDGPGRAVRAAQAIVEAVGHLGLEARVGIHTGEVETIDGEAGGLGVVIGARIGALARTSEVLVSQTVKDLTAGSGLTFEDAGERELKGVPDRWHLYRVVT
jgi:pimeloyl-ACP methyl ester carboxylesterase